MGKKYKITTTFTFYYIYINTKSSLLPKDGYSAFTFYYIYINTIQIKNTWGISTYLHSTIFILIQNAGYNYQEVQNNLHSTIFILIQRVYALIHA